MKSFEQGLRHEEDSFRRDTAVVRKTEAIQSARAGKGKETSALANEAQGVANELFETYKKLVAWPRHGSGGSTEEGQPRADEYSEIETRKNNLKGRYEELLVKLEEAGHVTTVQRLRKKLNESEEVFQRAKSGPTL